MAEQPPVKYFKSEIKRLNYYNSQFLVEKDFNDEQLYHKQLRRFHNCALHTWGIVEGLQVERVENENKVTVARGSAIDRFGQEIVLARRSPAVGFEGFDADAQVYVTIKYRDVQDPADKDTSDRQAEGERFKRWTERPEVSVSAAEPPAGSADVVLAVVKLDNEKTVAEVLPSGRRYAGARIGSSGGGGEFGIHADDAGAWHFFDGVRGADRLTVDEKGNVGVGTAKPLSRLHVRGDYQNKGTGGITLDASDNDNPELYVLRINPYALGANMVGYQFQTKSSHGGTNVPLAFDHEGKVGIGTDRPAERLDVRGHLVLDPGGSPNLFTGTGTGELGRYLQLLNSPGNGSASGLKVGSALIADDYGYANPGKNDLVVKGSVGVGTKQPHAQHKLEVAGLLAVGGSARGEGDKSGDMFRIEAAPGRTDSVVFRFDQDALRFWTPAGGDVLRVTKAGKVGLGPGTQTPEFPLSFPNVLGDKIALWGQSGNTYGFGIQSALLQIHTESVGADIAFGYGSSAAMTETMRVRGNGNVGIGTSDPQCRLTLKGAEKLVPLQGRYNSIGDSNPVLYATQGAVAAGVAPGDWVALEGREKKEVTEVSGVGITVARPGYGPPGVTTTAYVVRTADILRADDWRGRQQFLITGEGNVGIGPAASPDLKLLVDTAGGARASLKCEHRGSNFIVRPESAGSSATVIENTGGGALFINPNGAKVTIGTLEVTGDITMGATKKLSSGDGRFHISGGEILYILNKKGVVIGKEWEGNGDLSVQGNVRVDGGISCGGKVGFRTAHGTYVNANADMASMRQAPHFKPHEQFTIEMACSREFKENISALGADEAAATLRHLNPVKYDYKGERTFRQNLGFIAEEMPANLASADRKSISPFEVIPVLTRVAKEQQKTIAALEESLRALREEMRRRDAPANVGRA